MPKLAVKVAALALRLRGEPSPDPIPISLKSGLRRLALWPGLFIQARTIARGLLSQRSAQTRFSA